MQNGRKNNILNDMGDSCRSPSWGGPVRATPKNQRLAPNSNIRIKKSLTKSNSGYNSLPNLQVPGANYVDRTQSDIVGGNKTPSVQTTQEPPKSVF